jgi:hypothetical protein
MSDLVAAAGPFGREHAGLRGSPREFPRTRSVISSTPGAADFFKPKKLARKTSTFDVMQERRQFALSVPGDGFSYAGLRL